MAIKLERIGHCLLRVRDVARSKKFYMDILGFQLMEQDPEHGGVFMSLPGDGHTIDLFPIEQPDTAEPMPTGRDRLGLGHIAFKVGTYQALEEAYNILQAHGVTVHRMIDHVSQRSIYFSDPDGYGLEIYYEYPNARKLFMEGRGDQDQPFTFDQPLPAHAMASS
jgi:catechol-2,3-dioxygenase